MSVVNQNEFPSGNRHSFVQRDAENCQDATTNFENNIINKIEACSVYRGVSQTILLSATVMSAIFLLCIGPCFFQDDSGTVDYVVAAVPFYFLLLFLELGLMTFMSSLNITKAAKYDLADSWGSITAGMIQQLLFSSLITPFIKKIGPYFGYVLVWNKFALVRLDPNAWSTWVLAFFGADFTYYWMHRFFHTNALYWAGHQVHHSSEHYNLTTALRQSWWQATCSELLRIPMALIFPPSVYFINQSLNTVYQFWVHTCLIDRLGPLEWILSTPSHHRVHHDRRVHKNYGGVLIIWDRIFGTFLDEYASGVALSNQSRKAEEIELFGIMQPVESWLEPVLQYSGFKRLLLNVQRHLNSGHYLKNMIKSCLIGPGWHTTTIQRKLQQPTDASRIRVSRKLTGMLTRVYFIAQFGALLISTTTALMLKNHVPNLAMASSVYVLAFSVCLGLFLDNHPVANVAHLLMAAIGTCVYWPYWCQSLLRDLFRFPGAVESTVYYSFVSLQIFGIFLTASGQWISSTPVRHVKQQ